jgi:predicted glycosyltransferase
MEKKTPRRILYVSWQAGMGHITRDVAIARELRRLDPGVDISWLAHPLATKTLQHAGQTLLPESASSADYNEVGKKALEGFNLNLMTYVAVSQKANQKNVALFKQVINTYPFDLVIGDESYEVVGAMQKGEVTLPYPMVLVEDFVAMRAMTLNPLERLGIYQGNRSLVAEISHLAKSITRLFVGEPEDIPDHKMGFLLPNQREFAKKHYHFLGHIIRFNPADYADKAQVRARLGYGTEPLLVCATGGTRAGAEMLALCGKAYPLLKQELPDLHMVCICGELYGGTPPELPPEVEFHNLLLDIYEHYAASDMAVVVGGGTTTIELTALRVPFIFFPLEKQFDQQYIADRQARLGAGIELRYYRTTPQLLAMTIMAHIGKPVHWKPVSMDGAQKAAKFINAILIGGNEAVTR